MTFQCLRTPLCRGIITIQHFSALNTTLRASSSTTAKEKWDLVSSVCVERKPILTKELNQIEKKFAELLSQIEFERSHLSDHELRHKMDIKQAELLKKGEETDVEQALKQTAQDFEDACQDEVNKFQFSPRTTDADLKKDVKSLNRKLDASLLLLVEQTLGGKKTWLLPQGLRIEGETLRQTAERVLRESCGDNMKTHFLGNAPCGFYKYKYPKSVRDSAVGAKVFFFKALHVQGQVEQEKSKATDYKWLGREELEGNLHREYCNSVKQFLVDEN